MKLVRPSCELSWNLCSQFVSFRRVLWFSTATAIKNATRKPRYDLYRRITPVGDMRVSIVPVLDHWVEEGRKVNKEQLQNIVKDLRRYRRFKHALEVSQWMSDKRYFQLSSRDIAVRLDLISKVHGIKHAENYFDNIPEHLKVMVVYGCLLNSYAQKKIVEKAEEIMQKMRDLGYARTTMTYNAMLNLYCQTGMHEKLEPLMKEMEEKGIKCDQFSYGILLTSYAASSDTQRMDGIIQRMESNPNLVLDWNIYSVAANGYMKAGVVDTALAMLKKSEGLMVNFEKINIAYNFLLTQYAATGNKDEVIRLWELYKKKYKILNRGYISMITSLLKFDDIEGAEKIVDEWESSELSYDFRIPNFLIGAYCRKGLMEKAEALIERAKEKGGKPLLRTWYYLATGYVDNNQIEKAVEPMKVAILMGRREWIQRKDCLVACLEHLKAKGDFEEAEEFIMLLQTKGIVSTDVHDRLLNYVKNGKSNENVPSLMEENSLVEDEG